MKGADDSTGLRRHTVYEIYYQYEQNWLNFSPLTGSQRLWLFYGYIFFIGRNFEPTLANFCWVKFHCYR